METFPCKCGFESACKPRRFNRCATADSKGLAGADSASADGKAVSGQTKPGTGGKAGASGYKATGDRFKRREYSIVVK